jgi:hypothetical protein
LQEQYHAHNIMYIVHTPSFDRLDDNYYKAF